MKQLNIGIIGVGWCGGIRAEACARHALVRNLHLAEVRPERLAEVAQATGAATATADYRELLAMEEIDAVMISAVPEATHFPLARDSLRAGKHVLLEKPMAVELHEADELMELAVRDNLKFTIAYTQRFNPKFAYIRKCVHDGTIGRPVTALVSRHVGRDLGNKVTARTGLSLAMMGNTHDLDFMFWCLAPQRPVRVYSQGVSRVMAPNGTDCQWITVTMDDGVAFVVGAAHVMPSRYPKASSAWIEFMGTEGSLFMDDSHRDVMLTTMQHGIVNPISTMPGERVEHTYAGPMENETAHFIEAVAYDRPVLVTPAQARLVMETCLAADISARTGLPVDLPLQDTRGV